MSACQIRFIQKISIKNCCQNSGTTSQFLRITGGSAGQSVVRAGREGRRWPPGSVCTATLSDLGQFSHSGLFASPANPTLHVYGEEVVCTKLSV